MQLLGRYKARDYKKLVFLPQLAKVAHLLADLMINSGGDQKDREFEVVLRLIYDAIVSKEMARRPAYLH